MFDFGMIWFGRSLSGPASDVHFSAMHSKTVANSIAKTAKSKNCVVRPSCQTARRSDRFMTAQNPNSHLPLTPSSMNRRTSLAPGIRAGLGGACVTASHCSSASGRRPSRRAVLRCHSNRQDSKPIPCQPGPAASQNHRCPLDSCSPFQ